MKHVKLIVSSGLLAWALTGCMDPGTTAVQDDASQPIEARSRRSDTDLTERGVFVMSNAAAGNGILAYVRGNDGSLSQLGEFPTGGTGSGAGLGNQGGVAVAEGYLFAVNNASNDISVLKVGKTGLTLAARIASGGTQPISIAVHDDRVFVLNAGGDGNISGFHFSPWSGRLAPIPNSTRALSAAAAGPAQISFDPDGRALVVTEKMTGTIDTYPVDLWGRVGERISRPSVGMTPFGFAFSRNGTLVVSDAFGGGAGLGAMTSYDVHARRGISLISGPVADAQTAPCWVAITEDGRFAYTTNAGSGNVSSYALDRRGRLSLLEGAAGSTGMGSSPIDLALSRGSQYLYVNNSKAHSIGIFRVDTRTGALAAVNSAVTLPVGANGMAAL